MQFEATIEYSRRGDLHVTLTSPSGMEGQEMYSEKLLVGALAMYKFHRINIYVYLCIQCLLPPKLEMADYTL